ncbi:FAD dependent oxidoreductase [Jaminaea rosea]|uniref:FAD dependent oxidoreductase n=1 Tax=Jaminaea rosea TaxID=1569628 RepID=A0A316UY58_9BASI|nr:FAD dependent oxidoreductase [Jaminaea rosea]PWN29241.1 FAD dependent oxidoreductase [Jaminaea rosea]
MASGSSSSSSSSASPSSRRRHFIIVGSGVYGASTALTLVRLGHRVTVLERSRDGYAAHDSASNDYNKIIRSDYSNPHYRHLAELAIQEWRDSPLLSRYYHETGFVLASRFNQEEGRKYVDSCLSREQLAGSQRRPYEIKGQEGIARAFPSASHAHLGTTIKGLGETALGYANPLGGWAEAANATNAVLDEAVRLGADVFGGIEMAGLILEKDSTGRPCAKGVTTSDGQSFEADTVILAPGSWLSSLLKTCLPHDQMWHSLPHGPLRPSGQVVMTLQLDSASRARYANAPVVLDYSTGFYVFPPNADGIVKCAIHGPGFRFPAPGAYSPTMPTYGSSGGAASIAPGSLLSIGSEWRGQLQPLEHIPEDTETLLRSLLHDIYPELATIPNSERRVCWYADSSSLDENWLLDWHPRVGNLFLAGAGSGHGFKFLPCMGDIVAERMGLAQPSKWTSEENPWKQHQERVWTLQYREEVAQKGKAKEVRARL